MRELKELNINEGGRPVDRAAASDEEIQQLEEKYGILLPRDLRCLLKFSNGGHPELDSIHGGQGLYSVNRFYHLTSEDKGPESLWYAMEHWRPVLGEKSIPFANDGGGNQFYIDLEDQSSVKICLHDIGMESVFVAPSFASFIDSLEIDPDMI